MDGECVRANETHWLLWLLRLAADTFFIKKKPDTSNANLLCVLPLGQHEEPAGSIACARPENATARHELVIYVRNTSVVDKPGWELLELKKENVSFTELLALRKPDETEDIEFAATCVPVQESGEEGGPQGELNLTYSKFLIPNSMHLQDC